MIVLLRLGDPSASPVFRSQRGTSKKVNLWTPLQTYSSPYSLMVLMFLSIGSLFIRRKYPTMFNEAEKFIIVFFIVLTGLCQLYQVFLDPWRK